MLHHGNDRSQRLDPRRLAPPRPHVVAPARSRAGAAPPIPHRFLFIAARHLPLLSPSFLSPTSLSSCPVVVIAINGAELLFVVGRALCAALLPRSGGSRHSLPSQTLLRPSPHPAADHKEVHVQLATHRRAQPRLRWSVTYTANSTCGY